MKDDVADSTDSQDQEDADSSNLRGNLASQPAEVKIGGKRVIIPEGWYISEYNPKFFVLNEDTQDDLVKEAHHGLWPIAADFSFRITNGESRISINQRAAFIPGGVGLESYPLSKEYTIVKEPKEGESGFARKKDGDLYSYVEAVYVSDPDDYYSLSPEEDYYTNYFDNPSFIIVYMEFTGSNEQDLLVADKFFEEYILSGEIDFSIEQPSDMWGI